MTPKIFVQLEIMVFMEMDPKQSRIPFVLFCVFLLFVLLFVVVGGGGGGSFYIVCPWMFVAFID